MIEGVEDVVTTWGPAVGGGAVRGGARGLDLVNAHIPLCLADGVPGDTGVSPEVRLFYVPYEQRHVGVVRPGRLFHLVLGPGGRGRGGRGLVTSERRVNRR